MFRLGQLRERSLGPFDDNRTHFGRDHALRGSREELQPQRLWRLRKDIFGLGLAQVVLCGLALSLFIHIALDVTAPAALAIGLPLGLSSTAQVLPMLRADNELNTPQGERAGRCRTAERIARTS